MIENRASLLHPVYGSAAGDIRRGVDASQGARLARLEQALDATRRALTFDLKLFRGMRSDDPLSQVTPDSSGFLRLFAKPGSGLSVKPNPNVARHGLELDLDPAGLGCDCCPEDITWNSVVNGTSCIQFALAFDPVTCTLTATLDVDELCLCQRCDVINPPG